MDELFVAARCQASDKGSTGLELSALFVGWRVERGDDVRVPNVIADDARAGLFVEGVRVIGLVACAGLNRDLVAKLDELAHGVRRGRNQGFWLSGDTDKQGRLLTGVSLAYLLLLAFLKAVMPGEVLVRTVVASPLTTFWVVLKP